MKRAYSASPGIRCLFAHVAFAGTASANRLDKGETLRERGVWRLRLLLVEERAARVPAGQRLL